MKLVLVLLVLLLEQSVVRFVLAAEGENNVKLSPQLEEVLRELDERKAVLESLRPLAPDVLLQKFHQHKAIEFTYHSNALEGNTLDLSETRLIVEYGITVGNGKTLREVRHNGNKENIN